MPQTALLFGVGAAAISGLPPLNGFASEWLTFHGLIGAGSAVELSPVARSVALVAVGALALTAALAVACFVKATGIAFLAMPRSAGAESAREAQRSERLSLAGLAGLCVLLGLLAAPLAARLGEIAVPLVDGTAAGPVAAGASGAGPAAFVVMAGGPAMNGTVVPLALAGVLALTGGLALFAMRRGRRREVLRTTPTWTCGVLPEAGMAYTATSYSKLLRLFFRRVLLPERTLEVEYHPGTPLPASMRYHGVVADAMERRVFGPLHVLTVRASSAVRRLQNGSVQAYLGYALVGLVVLLALGR
jgi:hydrogenase-4 component B